MTTIAFIGLGIMGAPMAGHLIDAGHDVVGYNRSRAKVDRLVDRGGRAAASVADAVRDAELRYAQRYRTPRANPRRVVIEVRVERVLGSSDLLDRAAD